MSDDATARTWITCPVSHSPLRGLGRRIGFGDGGATIGPQTRGLIIAIPLLRPHPEQGFRDLSGRGAPVFATSRHARARKRSYRPAVEIQRLQLQEYRLDPRQSLWPQNPPSAEPASRHRTRQPARPELTFSMRRNHHADPFHAQQCSPNSASTVWPRAFRISSHSLKPAPPETRRLAGPAARTPKRNANVASNALRPEPASARTCATEAQVEDTDFRAARGLDRAALPPQLAGCDWIPPKTVVVITGRRGRQELASPGSLLGQKACLARHFSGRLPSRATALCSPSSRPCQRRWPDIPTAEVAPRQPGLFPIPRRLGAAETQR